MNKAKKLRVFLSSTSVLFVLSAVAAYAEDKNLSGESMSFGERFEYALQGTVTGLLMIFTVLALLWGIVSLSKVIFYDMPRRKKEKENKMADAVSEALNDTVAEQPVQIIQPEADDAQLAAVITAAVAAVIESGEYGDEFAGGFRVVSFKRVPGKKWNNK